MAPRLTGAASPCSPSCRTIGSISGVSTPTRPGPTQPLSPSAPPTGPHRPCTLARWLAGTAPHVRVLAVRVPLLQHDLRFPRERRERERVTEGSPQLLRFGRRDPLGKCRIVAAREDHASSGIDHLVPVVAGQPRVDVVGAIVRPRQRLDDEPIDAVRLDARAARLVEVESPRARRLLRRNERPQR